MRSAGLLGALCQSSAARRRGQRDKVSVLSNFLKPREKIWDEIEHAAVAETCCNGRNFGKVSRILLI